MMESGYGLGEACLTVPCRSSPYLAVPHRTLPCLTVPYRAAPYFAVPHRTLPCLTVPCRASPYLAVPHRCSGVASTLWQQTLTAREQLTRQLYRRAVPPLLPDADEVCGICYDLLSSGSSQ